MSKDEKSPSRWGSKKSCLSVTCAVLIHNHGGPPARSLTRWVAVAREWFFLANMVGPRARCSTTLLSICGCLFIELRANQIAPRHDCSKCHPSGVCTGVRCRSVLVCLTGKGSQRTRRLMDRSLTTRNAIHYRDGSGRAANHCIT